MEAWKLALIAITSGACSTLAYAETYAVVDQRCLDDLVRTCIHAHPLVQSAGVTGRLPHHTSLTDLQGVAAYCALDVARDIDKKKSACYRTVTDASGVTAAIDQHKIETAKLNGLLLEMFNKLEKLTQENQRLADRQLRLIEQMGKK